MRCCAAIVQRLPFQLQKTFGWCHHFEKKTRPADRAWSGFENRRDAVNHLQTGLPRKAGLAVLGDANLYSYNIILAIFKIERVIACPPESCSVRHRSNRCGWLTLKPVKRWPPRQHFSWKCPIMHFIVSTKHANYGPGNCWQMGHSDVKLCGTIYDLEKNNNDWTLKLTICTKNKNLRIH